MFDLTSPQQNIWNLQRFYEGTGISNICGSIFLEKKCDHILLNQAINKLIEEQDGMRLRFCEKEGKSVQYIYEYEAEQFVSKAFESRDEFEKYANEYAKEPFQLMDSQMYRFVIFDLEDQSGILLCANHLICDAWAISIIADTICEKYDELESGIYSEKKNYSYQSFIGSEHKYLQSVRYEKDREYWEKEYLEKPELCPIKPNCTKVLSPTANRYTTQISGEFSRAIDRFYEDYHISQAVLFETAIAVYLSKVNEEQKRISWGIPVLNRLNAAEKKAVGMNISTIPLTVSVSEEETAEVLCEKITEKHFQVFRHQRFPYSHILRNIHNQHDFSGNVYDVIVSFQNAKIAAKANTKWFSNGFCEVGMEFHVDNRDHAEMYTLNVDYQTELFFSETEVELLVKRILYVMEQIIENPKIQVREISILPIKEYQKVISEFNDTAVDYPKDKCVHELFQEQVQKNPEKAAVVFEGEKYTYRQIDEMSNALAHLLFEKGIRRGDIVPIIAKRSYLILVAMFGALKAGAAYMPVDPTYPDDRIESMLEEANVKLAFTLGYEKSLGIETVDLEKIDFEGDISQIENQNEPEDLCYIIYTSGSTGRPKGVVIPHSRVVNYSHNNNNNNVVHSIIKSEYRSIVSVTNIVFDIFVTESILPLLNGLTIYFANENQCYKQKELALLITENKVDVIQTTPTKMRSYLLDKKDIGYLKTLKAIVLGGEAFPEDLYKEISGHTDAEIFNIYGPAETTVWSTNAKVTGTDITIGRPIANTQIYILDKQQNPVPIGVAGELCISGDGVGKGYLNRPDLTAERFIPNPFIKGTMMYRTGDLARWRVDGEIEYLGRIDTQVKIRGLRIELGEIESVMAGFPGIQLVAVADKKDETGRQYLVGYYTSESQIDEKELRQLLTGKLPKYMVPNYFMRLDKMPMTASGKTDRKNLPIPEFAAVEREYIAPETAQEQVLCNVLAELFQAEQVSVEDDFFEIGGDSLRAIEYVAKAHNEGISFALQNVFDYPSVRQLCEYLNSNERVKVEYFPEDFVKYQPLLEQNIIDEKFIPVRKSLGNMFLTGATGFLGSHVLERFMKEESGKIYCLVRGGEKRLADTLEYYFGDTFADQLGHRIIAVEGDITRQDLADVLPDDVQTVVHTAATVKHYGSYNYFYGVNVLGTKHVIAYTKRVGAELLHISTLSVSGNSLVDAFDIYYAEETMEFAENSLYIGQPLDNVYIHSKFEAERAVLDAMLEGLDAKIIRVGNLTNRASDYKFQPNYQSNAFLTRVKAALELGRLPDYLLSLYAEFSPIDQTAEGIVKIAQYADRQTVFHLNSNRGLYFDRMIKMLHTLGISMDVVEGNEFNRILQQLAKDSGTEYIYEAFQNDMDQDGKLVYDSNIHILNDFTVWFLEKLGFQWIEIDQIYMNGYIEYFRKLDYLEV